MSEEQFDFNDLIEPRFLLKTSFGVTLFNNPDDEKAIIDTPVGEYIISGTKKQIRDKVLFFLDELFKVAEDSEDSREE